MSRIKFYEEKDISLLEKVDLSKIVKDEINENIVNSSGIKYLMDYVKKEINDCSFLIEYSLYSSCIEDSLVKYISAVSLADGYPLSIEKINKYYVPLYKKLKDKEAGVFFSNSFFKLPNEPQFFYSKESDTKYSTNILCVYKNIISEVKVNSDENSDSYEKLDNTNTNDYFFNGSQIEVYKEYKEADKDDEVEKKSISLHYAFDTLFCEYDNRFTSMLFSIPIIGPSIAREKYNWEGQGGIFLYLVLKTNNKFLINIEDKLRDFANGLATRFKDVILNVLLYSGIKLAKKARTSAIKSTVAAIMSRNMSHNLGSHVLSNLKNYLGNAAAAISKTIECENGEKFEKKDLYGLKWFINYLQERQDFIATIGGFENQTFMPVNFKSFVFDGFLPDDQYRRHLGSESINEHTNILLNYIAKSENISREKIVIKFDDFDSSKQASGQSKEGENSFNDLLKLNVSFPGGIVGRQAFFSIMENIIRNAAKHNSNIQDKLIITISNPIIENDAWKNDYHKITIGDNLGTYSDAKDSLGKAIKDKILPDATNSSNENKGLKEMRISAAWLRGINIEEIDDFNTKYPDKPPILTLSESNSKSIQYEFFLLKPKEVCIVIKNDDNHQSFKNSFEKYQEILKQKGVEIIFVDESTYEKNESYRHSLFVIDKALTPKTKEKISDSFNRRILDKIYFEDNYTEHENNKEKNNTIKGIIDASLTEIKSLENKKNEELPKLIENEITSMISKFWKIYLGYGNKDKLPYIDLKAKGRIDGDPYEKFRDNGKEKSDNDSAFKEDTKIIFKNHNDTKDLFNEFRGEPKDKEKHSEEEMQQRKSFFNDLSFLEGISGGNSTELLVTKTELTPLFYYKLLQSCLTKVLIIDERLWNNNADVSIEKLGSSFDEKILNDINNKHKNDREAWKNEVRKYLSISDDQLENLHSFRMNSFIAFKLLHNINVLSNHPSISNKTNDLYKYWLFKKKGIEVANILIRKDESRIDFLNLQYDDILSYPTKTDNNFPNNIFPFIQDEQPLQTEASKNSEPPEKFKIVSIHQGIIDKMINHVCDNLIKEEKKEKDTNQSQIRKAAEVEVINYLNDTFSDFIKIIHSGRGKPSAHIPEGFYYIPYASLENAFYDCKYSLTELLFNAKKEL